MTEEQKQQLWKRETFLQRMMCCRDDQLAKDMLCAAIAQETFKEHHLQWVLSMSKPNSVRIDTATVEGRKIEGFPPLSQRELNKEYDVDGTVVQRWNRVLLLFDTLYEEQRTRPGLCTPTVHNQLLSSLLARASTSSAEPVLVRKLADAVWDFCSKMELRGIDVDNAKSLEVLSELLEALESKQTNASSSESMYISRKEYLTEQERRLQQLPGSTKGRSGRSGPRPHTAAKVA